MLGRLRPAVTRRPHRCTRPRRRRRRCRDVAAAVCRRAELADALRRPRAPVVAAVRGAGAGHRQRRAAARARRRAHLVLRGAGGGAGARRRAARPARPQGLPGAGAAYLRRGATGGRAGGRGRHLARAGGVVRGHRAAGAHRARARLLPVVGTARPAAGRRHRALRPLPAAAAPPAPLAGGRRVAAARGAPDGRLLLAGDMGAGVRAAAVVLRLVGRRGLRVGRAGGRRCRRRQHDGCLAAAPRGLR
mmetsp:Transcript_856/g.2644  ORF Transcript_856/g.2644 Transcript_856/m.2644 type:complete len:247 (-) Transcript_856:852-1592(-)